MAREDWKLCVEWLVRCQILPPDHKLARDDAQVFDLAQSIRDGVLICHLLNHLCPGCISMKDFSQRPQMSQTCRTIFKLSDHELFDPNDLFEVKDFGKVINTLCILSCTTVAEAKTPGFQTRSRSDYTILPTLAGEAPDEEYDVVCKDDDTEIYEDLCALRRRTSFQEQPTPVTKRDHCIQELYETEKNYIDVLEMLIRCFIKRLNNKIPDFEVVFFGIENLHTIHVGFHSDLQKACSNRHNTFTNTPSLTIADCFIKWKEKFLAYGEFCSNLPRVQTMLDKLMQNQAVNERIMECQKDANGGKFRLRDLLSVPMQRVLKYHLLLKELIKNTDQQHPERKSLERALDEMQDLSGYVNEVKRDNENLQLIMDVEHSIADLDMPENTHLSEYGRLLKDGELRVRKQSEKKDRNLMLFVFDKVLMICKSRMVDKFLWNESYNFRDALVLDHYDVEDLPNKEKDRFVIQLTKKKFLPEPHLVWTLAAKTQEIRSKWIEAINLAFENRHPPFAETEQHKFVMATFGEPTICDVCRKLLRGIFYQGYRCEKTGMAVHKGCIEKAKDMLGPPVIPPKRDRVQSSSPLPGGGSFGKGFGQVKVKALSPYNGVPAPPNGQPCLIFEVNSVITLLSDEDSTWWQGSLQGREGFFPKNYVIVLKSQKRESYIDTSSDSVDGVVPPPPTILVPPPPTNKASRPVTNASCRASRPVNSNSVVSPSSSPLDDLSQFDWYMGELHRDEASHMLDKLPNGTFLIRVSNTGPRKGELALSIRYGPINPVKHIKVQRSADGMYFLVDCKMFRGIPELVQYYQSTSLERSFPEVPITLGLPYKEAIAPTPPPREVHEPGIIGFCQAQYDYIPMEPNQIAFKVGDKIAIISKSRGNRGWWKGKIDGKVGYFPSEYVSEL